MATTRLICFHPTGTGASFFASFLLDPPAGLDVIAIQLPGREIRSDEPAPRRVAEVVEEILKDLPGGGKSGDIFWGHSFGAIIAYEVLRALQRQGNERDPQLMVSGAMPPPLIERWQKRDILRRMLSDTTSPEYLLAVSRYVDNVEFARNILPAMRIDAPLVLGYCYEEQETKLGVSITAFGAYHDDLVYSDESQAWAEHSETFRFAEVEGDHWFVHRNRALFRKYLENIVAESYRKLQVAGNIEETRSADDIAVSKNVTIIHVESLPPLDLGQ
jgi:surfactin synthase thioesterase subunit